MNRVSALLLLYPAVLLSQFTPLHSTVPPAQVELPVSLAVNAASGHTAVPVSPDSTEA